MKKVFLLALFAFSAIAAFATDPAKFLPSDAGLLYYIDGVRFTQGLKQDSEAINAALSPEQQMRMLVQMGVDPSLVPTDPAIQAVFQKHSVTSSQLFSGAFFLAAQKDPEDIVILFNTAIPEKSMPGLLTDLFALSSNLTGANLQCQTIQSGKYVIYAFLNAAKLEDKGAICLTYVADDVALVFFRDADDLAKAGETLQNLNGCPALLAQIDRSQLANLYADFNRCDVPDEKIQQRGFDRVSFSENLLDANRGIVEVTFYCLNQQKLLQVKQSCIMGAMMAGGMLFRNDPSIINEIQQEISASEQGNKLTISLQITEALSRRINAYFSKPENLEGLAVPGMPNLN